MDDDDISQLRRLAHSVGYLPPHRDPRLVAWAVRDWPELLVRSENRQAIWFEPRCRWWVGRRQWWRWQVRLYAQTILRSGPYIQPFHKWAKFGSDLDLLLWPYCVSNQRQGDISVATHTRSRSGECYIEAPSGRMKETLNQDLNLFLERLAKVAVFITVNLPLQSENRRLEM
jgi:hypothetical protein